MTTTTRYAVRHPDGRYLNGKGGGRWSWKFGSPDAASIWHRQAQATQARNWVGHGSEVVAVTVKLP